MPIRIMDHRSDMVWRRRVMVLKRQNRDLEEVRRDLLAACEAIMADYERVELWGFSPETLAQTRAAIAKARGEDGAQDRTTDVPGM